MTRLRFSPMLVLMLALPLVPVSATENGVPGTGACEMHRQREEKSATVSIVAGAWTVECRRQGCAIRGPVVNGHRLQLTRQPDQRHWDIVLSLPMPADATAGVELVVDDGEPMRVPYEFLHVRAGGRVLGIRPEVAGIVAEALQGGRDLLWRYTLTSGAAAQVRFDISCLGRGGLLAAAQRELARMKAMRQLGK